jgi:mono/diheme cytochrome c family protein
MVWRLIALLAVGAAVVVVLRWATAADDAEAALLRPEDPAVVALGLETYGVQCAGCHGADLEGQPNWRSPGPTGLMPAPPHDETGHTWHHDDATLFELTKYGLSKFAGEDYQSAMPAYEGTLSDDEIIAVLSYIKSRWPDDVRARHDELNALAAGRD